MTVEVLPVPSVNKNFQTQTITATTSWTAPTGVTSVRVFAVGGGGGGGSTSQNYQSGGGGSGAVVEGIVTVTPGTSYTVTIGAGGAAGSSGSASDGSVGGETSFSTLLYAGYGGGGARGNSSDNNGIAGGGTNPGVEVVQHLAQVVVAVAEHLAQE